MIIPPLEFIMDAKGNENDENENNMINIKTLNGTLQIMFLALPSYSNL